MLVASGSPITSQTVATGCRCIAIPQANHRAPLFSESSKALSERAEPELDRACRCEKFAAGTDRLVSLAVALEGGVLHGLLENFLSRASDRPLFSAEELKFSTVSAGLGRENLLFEYLSKESGCLVEQLLKLLLKQVGTQYNLDIEKQRDQD
ncbi:hypothetical protein BY996DRAFT_6414610 [Phakopsora pachyrhizi]|nr:hypothetical protein BY996DRAFT_6414610 [Phakopsora pachyrhizi]